MPADDELQSRPRTLPNFPDPAFEPHSSFMFDDVTDDDEIRNMQRNIASLNVLSEQKAQQQDYRMLDDANNDLGQLESFGSPTMFFDQGDLASSLAWQKEQSPMTFPSQSHQSDIVNGRASRVVQHFGQITPPNDRTPAGDMSSHPARTCVAQIEPSISAKSERARNAANQRHAKAKKARKDSARSKTESPEEGGGGGGDSDGGDDKRERYREKNRLAAAKCRAKKKTNTEDLEESARHITATNNKLRAEERELRDLFSTLRHQALAHDPSLGCTCSAIHMYNHNKAQEAARGAAMGLASFAMPLAHSPSAASDGSVSPKALFAASRAQSFSASRSAFLRPPSRSEPLSARHGLFLPPSTGGSTLQAPKSDMPPPSAASPTDSGGDEFSDGRQQPDDHDMSFC